MAFGPKFRRGLAISQRISLLDTAPTIAKLMRLPQLASWEGRAVEEAIIDEWKMADLERVA